MRATLNSRIAKLEQASGVFDVCHVAHLTPDGRLVPSTPGARLAPFVAVMPEVCATSEEWLRKYSLPPLSPRHPTKQQ